MDFKLMFLDMIQGIYRITNEDKNKKKQSVQIQLATFFSEINMILQMLYRKRLFMTIFFKMVFLPPLQACTNINLGFSSKHRQWFVSNIPMRSVSLIGTPSFP